MARSLRPRGACGESIGVRQRRGSRTDLPASGQLRQSTATSRNSMMKKFYRCWAEIDLNALRANLAWIRHRVGPGVKVITVVKADAYGHGLKQIAGLLMQSGTDVFGVANLAEAQAIRSVGQGWPILMLGAALP